MMVVLMGVSGVGKTTIGQILAERTGWRLYDADEFHSAASIEKMRNGIALEDADRWPWLDRLGQAIGAKVAADGIVVAACSALRRVYRERLRKAIAAPVSFVLMDTDRDELMRRMTGRTGHYMPPSLLDSQINTLERPDPDEGILALDSRQAVTSLCAQTLTWLQGG